MAKDDHESWVTNEYGEIIGKDTTEYNDDGTSRTTHQEAYSDFFGAHATKITGYTDNDSDGTSSSYEGSPSSCVLATACLATAGLPSDCPELCLLREFRDTYVATSQGARDLPDEYSRIAPTILAQIRQRPDSQEVFAHLFAALQETVGLIQSGHMSEALAHCTHEWESLKRCFPHGRPTD